jgi:hypothetical protein
MEFRDKWNPSWEKGTLDIEVIDRLVKAREELEIMKDFPNMEQRKKIMIECKEMMRLIK